MNRQRAFIVGSVSALLLPFATAAAQTTVLIVSGMGEPASFGTDADALGDWDGDGISDLCVGMPEIAPGGVSPGTVCIINGHTGIMIEQLAGAIPKGRFGALVAGVGDVDGDGFVDVAVGSVPIVAALTPIAQVISGATGDVLLDKPLPFLGLLALDGVGDVDGDGHPDVARGGFHCGVGGSTSDPGDVEVWSGATGGVLRAWCGDGPGDHFGEHLAAAGDVNDDGYADVLVGARETDDDTPEGTGYVRVLSGFDGATLHTWDGPANDNSGFGEAVDGAGDVNGDGRPDILVGARQDLLGPTMYGSASVYSGLDGTLLHHVPGTVPLAQFGMEVAGPGDVDGDGLADFAVATTKVDEPGVMQPGYSMYSGADAALLHDHSMQAMLLGLSIGLHAAGDINGDGIPDLLARVGQTDPMMMEYPTIQVFSGAPVLFDDLGFALAGSQGTPHLQIEGVLAQGLPLTLSVTDGPPLAPIFLVIGAAATPLPFHGGTLVPTPMLIFAGLATDGAGALSLGTSLAEPPPSGLTVVLQAWFPDAAAPTHFAATNAVLGVTQ